MLVDTNVLSELARPAPDPGVLAWAATIALPIRVSVITLEELVFGLSWRPNARVEAWFRRFLEEDCELLPINEEIARRAGVLRGQLGLAGRPRTQADMLIAATAQAHQLALVTRNARDFRGCGIALLDPFTCAAS